MQSHKWNPTIQMDYMLLFFVSPNKNKAKIKNANGGNWVSCGELWFMDERDGLILVQIGRIR